MGYIFLQPGEVLDFGEINLLSLCNSKLISQPSGDHYPLRLEPCEVAVRKMQLLEMFVFEERDILGSRLVMVADQAQGHQTWQYVPLQHKVFHHLGGTL